MKTQKFYNTRIFKFLFTTKLGRTLVDVSFGWYDIGNWWKYSYVQKSRKDRTISDIILHSIFFCLLFYLSFTFVKFKIVIWILTFLMGICLINATILYVIQNKVLSFVRQIDHMYFSNQTEVDVDAILAGGTVIDVNGKKYHKVKTAKSVFLDNQNEFEIFDNLVENKALKKEFLGYKLKVYPTPNELTNNISDDVMQFLNVRFGFTDRYVPLKITVYKIFAPKYLYKKDVGTYKNGKWVKSPQDKESDL